MSFDRKWLERDGSDDSQGRTLWALGTCAGRSQRRSFQSWAVQLFQQALPACRKRHSPRTWALALDRNPRVSPEAQRRPARRPDARYAHRQAGRPLRANRDRRLALVRGRRVLRERQAIARPDPERTVGRQRTGPADRPATRCAGLAAKQLSPEGRFRPIGCNGFCRRGEPVAAYDQQPIEAHAMVSAAIEAHNADGDPFWIDQAHLAFDWFLCRNDLGQPLYDTSTGGCHDGLQEGRVNENQGAESTLAFLMSLAEMEQLENSLAIRHRQESSPLRLGERILTTTQGSCMQIKRTGIVLSPNSRRVVLRPFIPFPEERKLRIIARSLAYRRRSRSPARFGAEEFHGRHQRPRDFL